MPDNDSSETKPKPNEPAKPQNPQTPQNPQGQTPSNNQQNTTAPGTSEGAAAGTEAAQNGENGQATPTQAPSSGEALKAANEKAMKTAIPFAIGLESLPADALRKDTTAGVAGAGGAGGVFPSGGMGTAIDVPWSEINMDGYFNSDMNAKQLVCPMTMFQSFPVITSDGTITRATDHTSTVDGAGTNLGGVSDASVNSGKSGFPDGCNPAVLQSQHNGGVQNFTVGCGMGFMYIDAWFKKFFPELNWKEGTDRQSSYGAVRSGGWTGKLVGRGCLWCEVVFPTSNTTAKAFKVKFSSAGPAHEGPRFDIMPAVCLINDYRDIFRVKCKRNGSYHLVDGTNLAFLFQDCHYDYVKGQIIGYGPETYYKKCYPTSTTPFAANDAAKVFKESAAYSTYVASTAGGPTGVNGFSIVRVRFFIDRSVKDKVEKLLGITLPEALMQVNYDGGAAIPGTVQTGTQNAAPANSSTPQNQTAQPAANNQQQQSALPAS